MSYAKLFSSITESSLWSEPKAVRLLFVSMLAKADATGFVEAALPGLARVSNLEMKETEDAIIVLESPDQHSKNPDHEGRRVTKVPGGWMILNYEEYRNRRGEEERRIWMRDYMRDYRKRLRKPNVNSVSRGNPPLAKAEAEAEAEAVHCTPHNKSTSTESASRKEIFQDDDERKAGDIYDAYPRKVARKIALLAILKAMKTVKPEELLKRTKAFAALWNGELTYCPHPTTWFNQERFNDDPKTWRPNDNKRTSNPRLEGVCRSNTDFRAIVDRQQKEREARMAEEMAAARQQKPANSPG